MRNVAACVAIVASTTLLAASALPAPPAVAQDTPAQQQVPAEKPQVFRAGVEVVSLNVTVSDNLGRYITDL
jgi:hypothetical protein